MTRFVRRAPALLLLALAPALRAQAGDSSRTLVRYILRPSVTDSTIRRFDDPHYVVFERGLAAGATLLVFMPGTGGRPQGTTDFADVAAHQGYRVIGLEYTDTPAVAQICPRERDPDCSEKVRRKRIFGDDATSLIDDRPEESIVNRLVKLLVALDRAHPGEGWGQYLSAGAPNWPRIAVSGLSQGAGMAAYIAQRTEVARAVLFSSPWDNYGPRHVLAPWLTRGPGATPAERWFAVFHQREATADEIRRAYAALRIPESQIRVFTLDPSPDAAPGAYHPSVVGNRPTPRLPDGTPAYLEGWRWMLGDARPAGGGGQ